MTCRCESCRFTAKVARIQSRLPDADRAVIEELLLKWAHADTDASYYRARLDGTWPDAERAR